MDVTGIIKRILEEKQVGASNFRTRSLWLETEEQYPQVLDLQFVQDKCDLLDNYQPGMRVEVAINLRGREWTNPEGEVIVFNTIQGWNIKQV